MILLYHSEWKCLLSAWIHTYCTWSPTFYEWLSALLFMGRVDGDQWCGKWFVTHVCEWSCESTERLRVSVYAWGRNILDLLQVCLKLRSVFPSHAPTHGRFSIYCWVKLHELEECCWFPEPAARDLTLSSKLLQLPQELISNVFIASRCVHLQSRVSALAFICISTVGIYTM